MNKPLAAMLVACTLTACAGVPVQLGTRSTTAVPDGPARQISARGCGFQLLWVIPIVVNSRLQRAYQELLIEAGSDYITDVEVKERWTYGFVGTSYCTVLEAKAIKARSTS